jgi:peptide/nickel transport system ATP-binding protein
MTAPVLEIRNLVKTFPIRRTFGAKASVVRAVDDVSFTIAKGEVFGLAGESGSGKSTIARMIMGLTQPDSGDILMDGRSILGRGASLDHRAQVQMVFQNPGASLNPRRTVGQSVRVALDAHRFAGDRWARVAELLDMVQLPGHFADRFPHELSGGQKQRVAIARALAVEPRLLVLDEPTSALDVSVQARVIDLLEGLVARLGLTYMFISHDLSLMRNFAQRIGVLYLGQIVETGPVDTVFADPQHDYTRLLIASVPVISAAEAAMRPVIPLIDGEIPTTEALLALRRSVPGGGIATKEDKT